MIANFVLKYKKKPSSYGKKLIFFKLSIIEYSWNKKLKQNNNIVLKYIQVIINEWFSNYRVIINNWRVKSFILVYNNMAAVDFSLHRS